ncbi:MAG TPA: hypothetical protein VNU01_11220 [Egibacteraceae bacterium]|nr:hypothetical protein [Egibacteraceae bacterium]
MAITRTRLAAIGVAGVLSAGAAVGALSPAIAQDAEEAPSTDTRAQERAERHEQRREAFASALAEELDLPVERVGTALDNVREQMRAEAEEQRLAHLRERLDAAVADGRLTQEQADAIYAAAESGAMPFGGRPGGHHRGVRGGPPPAGGGTEADATSA